jgi:hypothetical protein
MNNQTAHPMDPTDNVVEFYLMMEAETASEMLCFFFNYCYWQRKNVQEYVSV